MSKPTLSGYLNRTLEGGKLENMIYSEIGDIEYLKNFGIDRKFFFGSDHAVQSASFESYIRQMAMFNQILISSIKVTQVDFDWLIDYKISNEQQQQSSFNLGKI